MIGSSEPTVPTTTRSGLTGGLELAVPDEPCTVAPVDEIPASGAGTSSAAHQGVSSGRCVMNRFFGTPHEESLLALDLAAASTCTQRIVHCLDAPPAPRGDAADGANHRRELARSSGLPRSDRGFWTLLEPGPVVDRCRHSIERSLRRFGDFFNQRLGT